ncbi:MAG: hypothetical protein OQJ98_03140 [Candidatus Pacebacteria bacterium]|nr:hypothetical protein [Candidatus Paceibacterota bacterium]
MKKFIFINLILLALLTPVSFSSDVVDTPVQLNTAYAQNTSAPPTEEELPPGTQYNNDGFIESSCSSPACWIRDALNSFMETIAFLPIYLTSFFLYVAGGLLDVVMVETVVKLGTYLSDITAITETWGVLRDLANIFFIFGLLIIAISTILGVANYGAKKLLATLILVALVINFSLFFTKFVIDASNIFALQFYQGIVGSQDIYTSQEGDSLTGITAKFMNHSGIGSLWDNTTILKTLNKINYQNGGIGVMFIYSIFTGIFFLVAAFVFFFAAGMLIMRAVGFIGLMILSPIAFAAFVLPQTQKWTWTWWKKLWEYAIFAPALFILFWAVAKVMPGVTAAFTPDGAALAGILAADPGGRTAAIKMVLNFSILTSLMLGAIMVAKNLSIAGGKGASQLASKATFGTIGTIGRHTLGRGFRYISQSEGLKEAASQGGARGFAARQALKATRVGAGASYDIRATRAATEVAKSAGADLGKPQKGGYEAVIKKQIEDRKSFAKTLGPDVVTESKLRESREAAQNKAEKEKEVVLKEKRATQERIGALGRERERRARDVGEYAPEVQDIDTQINTASIELENIETKVRAAEEREKQAKSELEKVGKIGKERAESYANVLGTSTIERLGIKVPRKNQEATIAIRKEKSKKEKLADLAKEVAKEEDENEEKEASQSDEKPKE